MIRAKARVTGGQKIRAMLAKAGKGGVKGISIGFFASARYPDGTPVAAVAGWNEFGTRNRDGSVHIPERPFMRNAVTEGKDEVAALIRGRIDGTKMIIDRNLAELVGQLVQGHIQKEIVDLREPINAESTVKSKGSDNPLVDTGTMRTAVTYEVAT